MSQAIALAAVQDAIAAKYPDRSVELIAQVHYIRPDDVARIDVCGCDDAMTRRSIRTDAVRLLQQLGIHVELVGGHDVYTVPPNYSDPVSFQDYASRLHHRLITTADFLRAYSEGSVTRDVAMSGIGVKNYRDFRRALFDCGFGHATIRRDIELSLLTDPTPAGSVYVDLEGINPRILAHTNDKTTFIAYAKRVLSIFEALHGEFRADTAIRMRGMTFSFDTVAFTSDQRAAARPALAARLADSGCSNNEIEQLIGLPGDIETISEYAMRIIGDDPIPPARIPKPRKRLPPPRSRPLSDDSDNDDD
ncbi:MULTISPECIES: hypothetical protein [unclassified Sulfitobacter]|uniref:hypothetical protein n=1 Tax=unclassified Sulfitobacter TaxID=196795 RepID=UPI0037471B02